MRCVYPRRRGERGWNRVRIRQGDVFQCTPSVQNTNLELLINSMLLSLGCLEKVAKKKHIEKPLWQLAYHWLHQHFYGKSYIAAAWCVVHIEKGMWWTDSLHHILHIYILNREVYHSRGYMQQSIWVHVCTWGKGSAEASSTFSGFRSQWTMFLKCRCLSATRIYPHKNKNRTWK